MNVGQGDYNALVARPALGMRDTRTVTPPNDVIICNGRVYEAVQDSGGQSTLAMYPKQPFDIAGRTGTVVFDVSADSDGPHDVSARVLVDGPARARASRLVAGLVARTPATASASRWRPIVRSAECVQMFVNPQLPVTCSLTLVDCVRKGRSPNR